MNNKRKKESTDYNNDDENDHGLLLRHKQQQTANNVVIGNDNQRVIPTNSKVSHTNCTNNNLMWQSSFVEDMIAVPVHYIFREIPIRQPNNSSTATMTATPGSCTVAFATPTSAATKNSVTNNQNNNIVGAKKPLLSRLEAQCFLQINLLAYELDALTSVSIQALHNRNACREYSKSLKQQSIEYNPYLRSILSLLYIHYETIPNSTVEQITNVLQHSIVPRFRIIIQQLEQYSEQNYALADTLDVATSYHYCSNDSNNRNSNDSATMTNTLADEKRKLSFLQEELCHRIEALLLTYTADNDNNDSSNPFQTSIKDYCDQLFLQQPQKQESSQNDEMEGRNVDVPQKSSPAPSNQSMKYDPITTPISSPDVSIQHPMKTFTTTATTMSAENNTTNVVADTFSLQQQLQHQPDSVSLCRTSLSSQQQRQLEHTFRSSTSSTVATSANTAITPWATSPTAQLHLEENEKENEPSQTSIHSVQSTNTVASSQKSLQQKSTVVGAAKVLECHTMKTLEIDNCHDLDPEQQHHSSGKFGKNRSNGNDNNDTTIDIDGSEMVDDDTDDCFRTQGAAEVLSALAKMSKTSTDVSNYSSIHTRPMEWESSSQVEQNK